jgi:hypothetical protein
MLGDFFTKPLQGTQFVRMRSKILNLPSSSSTAVHRSVLKNAKKYDGNDKEVTGLNTRLGNGGSKIVIGKDGNSRNYAVGSSMRSG